MLFNVPLTNQKQLLTGEFSVLIEKELNVSAFLQFSERLFQIWGAQKLNSVIQLLQPYFHSAFLFLYMFNIQPSLLSLDTVRTYFYSISIDEGAIDFLSAFNSNVYSNIIDLLLNFKC